MSSGLVQSELCNLARQYKDGLGYLRLYVSNPELKKIYQEAAFKHNEKIFLDSHPNSGFDLYTPEKTVFTIPYQTKFIDLGVKCEMFNCNDEYIYECKHQEMLYVPCAFYMYPRSSISKTPLMLANHTGVIDSGYRGSLIAAVRYLPESQYTVMIEDDDEVENDIQTVMLREHYIRSYTVEKDTRLFQICHPSLLPIYVEVLDENELSQTTRGVGGFGSTGK